MQGYFFCLPFCFFTSNNSKTNGTRVIESNTDSITGMRINEQPLTSRSVHHTF
ncbi:hypothetical protein PHET_04406 [Paragonimus heterotremus]|uniref:Uncharacterized protein n=1 Tax=Paragonimus heterotremus TaxID=100268 RepID=A0A8J4T8T6_9TREM|nr:hypothetical protein PHET_04406 [Paragonimus heterotremus]